jgi:hypothetical protein
MEAWGATVEVSPEGVSEESTRDSKPGSNWNQDREQARRVLREGTSKLERLRHLEYCGEGGEGLDDEEERELDALRAEIGKPDEFLKELSKQKAIADGRKLADRDDRAKKRAAMLSAINRVLSDICEVRVPPVGSSSQRAARNFSNHIRSYLTRGGLKFYDPPPGVSWELP